MAERGHFISFEGSEGCGKSTQARMLALRLREAGKTVLLTREPGGTVIGDEIRQILQYNKSSHNMTHECEMLLFSASRAQHVREAIQPALARGEIVLCDRFLDSTTAYQGYGRKLPLDLIAKVHQLAVGDCLPELTIVIDVDPRIGLERARGRELFDRMENQAFEFYERARQGYLELARQEPKRFVVIEGARPIREVQADVETVVSKRLGLL
jgi:dTMP kinase